jgi:hypothetical protein
MGATMIRRPGSLELFSALLLIAFASIAAGCERDETCAAEAQLINDLPLLEIKETLRIGSTSDPNTGFTSIGQVEEPIRVPFHFDRQTRVVSPRMMHSSGFLISDVELGGMPAGVELRLVQDTIITPRLRYTLAGSVHDTIGSQVSVQGDFPGLPTISVGQSHYTYQHPPPTLSLSLTTAAGSIQLESEQPESDASGDLVITWRDLNNNVIRRRVLHYRPHRYSEARVNDDIASRIRSGSALTAPRGAEVYPPAHPADSAAAHARIRELMNVPAFRSPVSRLHSGNDGAIWLQPPSEGESHDWIVLDTSGVARAALRLPLPWIAPIWSSGNRFAIVEKDQFDVPFLMFYRFEWPGD